MTTKKTKPRPLIADIKTAVAQAHLSKEEADKQWRSVQVYLGSMMADHRKLHQIDAAELAQEMNISPSFLSRLERGERTWSDELVQQWDDAVEHIKNRRK